jgi:TetR/AcrR family transcriptional regulator, transcriptional repressor for nem operon
MAMRYPTQHKDRTRRKIIESAAHLFSARGFAATSIEDIMSDCGLTRGAFYAHFQSKGRLYREAIGQSCARSSLAGDATGRIGEDSWVESVLYDEGDATDLAFLAADLATDDREVRTGYGKALRVLCERLRSASAGASRDECSILSALALVVGGRALARLTDDEKFKRKLLASCREGANVLLESGSTPISFFWEPLS